jgi:hypothetical protein
VAPVFGKVICAALDAPQAIAAAIAKVIFFIFSPEWLKELPSHATLLRCVNRADDGLTNFVDAL